jgi:hypothetical protein
MRHFMYVCDEHLVWVKVVVERDDANAVFRPWGTEVTQLGVAWSLEVQLETPLRIHLSHHHYRGFGEIAFQQFLFLNLHRYSF